LERKVDVPWENLTPLQQLEYWLHIGGMNTGLAVALGVSPKNGQVFGNGCLGAAMCVKLFPMKNLIVL
jgi:hypothetical protein